LSTSQFSSTPTVTRFFKVIKSENDGREYRYLVLPNSMRVLLVSDMTVEKSAVALNVNIGNYQNPKQRPGFAHFLEHTLFLGSVKYPEVGSFQQFISTHGGENNAYTADENTNYYFDVDSGALDPALDRFAQFFIAPTFDADYMEREKNAVNTEYLARLNDDVSREKDVYRTLFNTEHPAANFPVGKLETLADAEGSTVRDELIAFYQNFYSANLMTLSVVGNHRLDDLQKMVESRFSQVRNLNIAIVDKYPNFFTENFLPASVSVKPLKEMRKLTFTFPMPGYSSRYQSKPVEFLSHLIGHEGAGSILALLKSLGWAESIQVSPIFKNRQQSLFHISIDLTKAGAKSKDQITSVVFDYLKIVSSRGIADWRFSELKQMAELNFRYGEKLSVVDTANEMAQAMQDYSPQDVLKGPYDYHHFNENIIKDALGHLSKSNALITFVAPEANTTATSNSYQVPYNHTAGIPAILDLKAVYH
ncbi:MAG: peptidase M16, partial [Chitinophagaceae bacterium]